MRFVHETLPQRVCFGSGEAAVNLGNEIGRLGAARVMLIASQNEMRLADTIAKDLPVALRYDEVVMHVPVEVAKRARQAAAEHRVDALVSVGGGSTTGLAKAVALTAGLPVVAVPTTYAGSEATAVWGLTEGAKKTTGTDPRVLPASIVYDAALTMSLPVAMSVASGLNALAHCIDAMWGPTADPVNAALAAEGIRALRSGLPKIVADPMDLDGRESALYAAYLSAAAFASAGSGLHHKICHVLGGKYNLPHAQTHATVLPYVLAFNGPAAPAAERRIAAAFSAGEAGGTAAGAEALSTVVGAEARGATPGSALDGLLAFKAELDAPHALADYGFTEDSVADAAAAILPSVPPSNPRPVTAEDLQTLLRAAWSGADPRAAC
ncbi:MAG TPA: maleylacetate reductase [Trebonia sp.]|jgi:alcohol dehydrogenase class IV